MDRSYVTVEPGKTGLGIFAITAAAVSGAAYAFPAFKASVAYGTITAYMAKAGLIGAGAKAVTTGVEFVAPKLHDRAMRKLK